METHGPYQRTSRGFLSQGRVCGRMCGAPPWVAVERPPVALNIGHGGPRKQLQVRLSSWNPAVCPQRVRCEDINARNSRPAMDKRRPLIKLNYCGRTRRRTETYRDILLRHPVGKEFLRLLCQRPVCIRQLRQTGLHSIQLLASALRLALVDGLCMALHAMYL